MLVAKPLIGTTVHFYRHGMGPCAAIVTAIREHEGDGAAPPVPAVDLVAFVGRSVIPFDNVPFVIEADHQAGECYTYPDSEPDFVDVEPPAPVAAAPDAASAKNDALGDPEE